MTDPQRVSRPPRIGAGRRTAPLVIALGFLVGAAATAACTNRSCVGLIQLSVLSWAIAATGGSIQRARAYERSTMALYFADTWWVADAFVFIAWETIIAPPRGLPVDADLAGIVLPFATITAAVLDLLAWFADRSARTWWRSAIGAPAAIGVTLVEAQLMTGRTIDPRLLIGGWGFLLAALALAELRPDLQSAGYQRLTRTRQVLTNAPVVLALWVATWHYVAHSRRPTTMAIVLGLLTGVQFLTRGVASWHHSNVLFASLETRISEQLAIEEELRWMATHDTLTALPNRFLLDQRLRAVLAEGRAGDPPAVLFVDLDNFKLVNDSLGHARGDELLRATAHRLHDALGEHPAELFRFGGDEFVVLVPHDDHTAGQVADDLRLALNEPFDLGGSEVFVSASIGLARADRPDVQADDLVRRADTAMYRAKAHGRNRVETAPDEDALARDRLHISAAFRRGIEDGRVVPFFQPIFAAADTSLVGFEALARWQHPTRGLLEPAAFLEIAEEDGLLPWMGAHILDAAVQALAASATCHLDSGDGPVPYLSVNASVHQLLDEAFPARVAAILDEHRLPPERLWLEITETALMSDLALATTNLLAIRDLGVNLSVDDFGTGYASLTYLQRFPVGAVKIDRSFVSGIGLRSEDTTIVQAVVDLGHALGLRVVAEGVETHDQLDHLARIGCDAVQGYLLGRPCAAIEDHVLVGGRARR